MCDTSKSGVFSFPLALCVRVLLVFGLFRLRIVENDGFPSLCSNISEFIMLLIALMCSLPVHDLI